MWGKICISILRTNQRARTRVRFRGPHCRCPTAAMQATLEAGGANRKKESGLRPRTIALVGVLMILWALPCLAENWPGFRGPVGRGISREKNLPVAWSLSENLAWRAIWKQRLKGTYGASPVLAEGRLYCLGEAKRHVDRGEADFRL